MIGWLDILTMLAVVMAILGVAVVIVILVEYARRIIPKKPSISLEMIKPKKEKPKMSKEKGESITFNDILCSCSCAFASII